MEKELEEKILFCEEDAELAERYLNALEKIERLEEGLNWNEDDVELAERYASALYEIEEKTNKNMEIKKCH